MNKATHFCDGHAAVSVEAIATHPVDTWDEGDGWITRYYCDECFDGLEEACDRCGARCATPNIALCQECIDDYNAGHQWRN